MSVGSPEKTLEFIQLIRLARNKSLSLSAYPYPIGNAPEVCTLEKTSQVYAAQLGIAALSGPKGVLPDYLQEATLQKWHQDDQALAAFLDVLNESHYRLQQNVLQQSHLLLRDEQERTDTDLNRDFSQQAALNDIAGLSAIKQSHLFEYSILLGMKTRSLAGLKQLLSGYFSVPVVLQATPEKRFRLKNKARTRLGKRLGRNQILGQGSLLGKTASLAYQTLEIRLIPDTREDYLRIQQDTELAASVYALSKAYLRDPVDLRLYLYVKRAFIQPITLAATSSTGFVLGEGNCLAPERAPDEFRKIVLRH